VNRRRSWWNAIVRAARASGEAITAAEYNVLHLIAVTGCAVVLGIVVGRASS
jgi:hypothetical protein